MHRLEDGTYAGFNIDYLNALTRYANWTYDYITYDTLEDALGAIVRGEADLLPSLYQTPERAAVMQFSAFSVSEMFTTLCVRPDDERFAYDDFEAFEGMRVGVADGSPDAEAFEQYRSEHDLNVITVPLEHGSELLPALENGSVDAIATTYNSDNDLCKMVARFQPEPLYIGLPAGADALAFELDAAMDALTLRFPEYFSSLTQTYFGINTDQDPLFTREEDAYLASAPSLTVAYASFRMPLSYTDPATGQFAGISASLFADIARITGLTFEFVPKESQQDVLAAVSAGEIDIAYTVDPALDRNLNKMQVTGAYMVNPMATIAGKHPDGKRLALPQGFSLSDEIAKDEPGYTITYYATPKMCFDAVLDGKADIAYADIHVANYLLAEPQYTSLNVVTLTDYANSMALGISDACDPRLASILDRCVQFTSNADTMKWATESSLQSHPTSPMDIVRQYPLQIMGGITLLGVLISGALVYIFRNRARNAERISRIVNSDPLTGGWSFARFQSEASAAIAEGRDHEHVVIYIDINRFKGFNATFGYAEGDKLLRTMSDLIASLIFEGEYFARISADQFVILTHWQGVDDFNNRLDTFDTNLNANTLLDGRHYRVLLKAGIIIVPAGALESEDSLTNLIDCARYARESIGNIARSTSAVYSEDMKESDIAERALQVEAIAAFERGEFEAYYQPKTLITTSAIVGFEALARWISPNDGVRSPAEFIPLFEKSGFITELDLHIFRLACQRIRAQMDTGTEPLPLIACNFSRLHLQNDRFPETLKAIIDTYGVPACQLELELTESTVMEDYEVANIACHRLKKFGFSVSIDDFGKGYSSLGTLQDLPIDVLKLDQSFLMNSEDTPRGQAILKGVVGIAQALEVKVVVEGVETIEQANMLKALDPCIIAQGFLYSQPVPLEVSDQQFQRGSIKPGGA